MTLINTGHSRYPHTVRVEKAKQFIFDAIRPLLASQGTMLKNRTPYQPQENARAERIKLELLNGVKAALKTSNLPFVLWEDALKDSVFKYNTMQHAATGQCICQLH